MNRLERILVVVDARMRHTPALQRGAELARRAAASLQLCLLDHHPLIEATADIVDPEVMRLAKAQFLAERTGWLMAECDKLRAQGLRVGGEVRWAPVLHDALLDRVLEHRPDLVIKDADVDDARAGGLLAAPDWKLLRLCPAPLMLVRPASPALPKNILVGVDTTGNTQQHQALDDTAVRIGQRLGLYCEARVCLAHVFPFGLPATEHLDPLDAAYEDLRGSDATRFKAYAGRHGFAEDRQHLLAGDPATALAAVARDHAFDLIIAGSLYRSAMDRFFLGSTAESLIARAACDVLLVKPYGFLNELRRHLDLDTLRQRQALLQDRTGAGRIPAAQDRPGGVDRDRSAAAAEA